MCPLLEDKSAHHRVNPYPGARRQNETKMSSDHDETNLSITAVSGPLVACSMLAVPASLSNARHVGHPPGQWESAVFGGQGGRGAYISL